MMNEKTYTCTECSATCSPEAARKAAYRCPHCRKGYLIAQQSTPASIGAVSPARLEVEPAAVTSAVEPEVRPPTLEAALRSALTARRLPQAQEASEAVPEGGDASSNGAPNPIKAAAPTSSSHVSAWLVLPPPF